VNNNEVKQVTESVERTFAKAVKATKEDPAGDIYKVTLPFLDRKGEPFCLWTFRQPKSKKIILSDSRRITNSLGVAGATNLKAVQLLVGTYGLTLMEDKTVMDISNRPLTKRVSSFLQALVAVDGTLRMWDQMREEVKA
jgi:hypothetical protein